MRYLLSLPMAALVGAVSLAGIARALFPSGGPLSELEIGLIAWSFVLGIFGVQGLIGFILDGPEPRPGTCAPHPSRSLSMAIAAGCVLLVGLAAVLAGAILTGQSVAVVGVSAGAGCLLLAIVLDAYKHAFVGEEVRVETRQDGIPW